MAAAGLEEVTGARCGGVVAFDELGFVGDTPPVLFITVEGIGILPVVTLESLLFGDVWWVGVEFELVVRVGTDELPEVIMTGVTILICVGVKWAVETVAFAVVGTDDVLVTAAFVGLGPVVVGIRVAIGVLIDLLVTGVRDVTFIVDGGILIEAFDAVLLQIAFPAYVPFL